MIYVSLRKVIHTANEHQQKIRNILLYYKYSHSLVQLHLYGLDPNNNKLMDLGKPAFISRQGMQDGYG